MRAIEIAEPGDPDVLRPVQRAVPRPADGEVLIRVAAAGVNRPDIMQRLGKYPPPPGASDIPGLEIAGTVVAGESPDFGSAIASVRSWPEADTPSTARCRGSSACPCPMASATIEAAAIPETFFTVWTNLFERGGLRTGETVLIHGGTSGIGTTAIQLSRVFGATVLATAGTDEKCAACERLGAAYAINYKTTDFVAAVRHATGGVGVDVILDIVGRRLSASQSRMPGAERTAGADRPDGRFTGLGEPESSSCRSASRFSGQRSAHARRTKRASSRRRSAEPSGRSSRGARCGQ